MKTVIIDVRTPKEFRDGSIPGAINIPSNQYSIEDFAPFKDQHICLVCQTGKRASSVLPKLKEAGFKQVSLLDKHIGHISENLENKDSWTVDRQFRLVLAVFMAIFLIGIYWDQAIAWAIPAILLSGLSYSAITDNCYLKILISMMPWNKQADHKSYKTF